MDAFVEEAWQAPIFRKRRLLYLHCFDTRHVFELTVPSLPFLKLKCLFGHVSFPGALSERRIVVFPRCERSLGKLKDVVSPCAIVVTSSVNFQIHPDEVEDDSEVMLIWDFSVDKTNLSLTASQCSVAPRTPRSAERLPNMPLLDVNKVVCNCGNVSRQRKVVLESCAAASAVSDLQKLSIADEDGDDYEEFFESSGEEEEDYGEFAVDIPHVDDRDCKSVEFTCNSNMANSAEALFTESFTLKGSSYHEHFQRGLKSCKEQLMQKISVPIKLRFEPVNRRDENAILVLAYPGNSWEPIGYIPGIKVTQAVRNEEITSMTIKSVRYQYIFPISSFKYFATVTISKRGKWLKNKDLYKYNEEL